MICIDILEIWVKERGSWCFHIFNIDIAIPHEDGRHLKYCFNRALFKCGSTDYYGGDYVFLINILFFEWKWRK